MTIPALNCAHGDDAMPIFGYVAIGFLIVCILLAATKSLSVGSPASMVIAVDAAQVVASDATQSSQDRAEEEDLLNMLD
jgi:hypothetical protein